MGHPKTRTLRVLWMLHELGLDFDHVASPPRADDVTALNPLGRIPVLTHEDAVLTDSVAIMAYLGERHQDIGPKDGLPGLSYPAGTPERAVQDAMVLRLIDEFDALLWTRSRHRMILPPEQRVPEIFDSVAWELKENTAKLGESLGEKPFILGDKMSIADIMATHVCGWAISGGVPLDPPKNLSAYLKRLRTRHAYARALGRA
ncbi:MAG: glutathione S-transferase family protein [Pseudomonadota bacterium]